MDDLIKKRNMYFIDVIKFRKHKNHLNIILKQCRCNRNKVDRGLKDNINILLHKFDIKCEVFGGKLNGVKCRRLIKNHVDIIGEMRDIFVDMNKGIVSNECICLITNKYKTLLKYKINGETYRCIRPLFVNDNVVFKVIFLIKRQRPCGED